MQMTVVSSGSSGNCYVLQGRRSSLLLECGVRPERVMKDVPRLDWSKLSGVLVSHEHGDHAGYAKRFMQLGVDVYASSGTLSAIGLQHQRHAFELTSFSPRWVGDIGEFKVYPFNVEHDAAEPLGFIIEHQECGRILFVTDTRSCGCTFRKMELDHIMVEANYGDEIIDRRVETAEIPISQASRVKMTHMSIRSACELLRANETGNLKTVTLIHLSDRNSDEGRFVKMAEESVLFAKVRAARPGMTFDMNKEEI